MEDMTIVDMLAKQIERYGKKPKVYYDRDDQRYWVGWKRADNGAPIETSMMTTGSKVMAEWVLGQLLATINPT